MQNLPPPEGLHLSGLSTKILELIFDIRNLSFKPSIPQENRVLDQKNWGFHINKIKDFIEKDQSIHMVLPAFPAKSPNPRKTLTHQPDYGEVLALTNLNKLCERISEIYPPGAYITICSDGRVFSDIVQVCDKNVDAYSNGILNIIQDRNLKYLLTFSLDNVFSNHEYHIMRHRLITEFAENIETIQEQTTTSLDFSMLFNGIHRFLFEDQLVLHPEKSKNYVRKQAKILAYQVIQRSNAWSRIVEKQFPEALRLSIHPQPAHSTKIGIRLLPSNDLWRTPWHSVVVFNGEKFFLTTRELAEEAGGVLTYAENKYPYYRLHCIAEAVA
jgi:pyoverdine/dityrosine biosynthesis protein Dit1